MTQKKCMLQAHRGVSSDRPENTMVAYREAVAQGYDLIELDPKMTKDNVPVLLHDKSINRTARDKDGRKIEGDKVFIADLTYAEACEYEYGGWFAPEYKGEHMPLLSEVLEFSKEAKIPLKFDNCMQSFTDEQLDVFFTVVEEVGDMSLIGPRPALWNQDDLIAERDKYGANDIRPGLTGWAQINGRDELEIDVKAKLDGEYVEKLSFVFDVKCFFGTILSVLKSDGVVEGGTGELNKEKEVVSK